MAEVPELALDHPDPIECPDSSLRIEIQFEGKQYVYKARWEAMAPDVNPYRAAIELRKMTRHFEEEIGCE